MNAVLWGRQRVKPLWKESGGRQEEEKPRRSRAGPLTIASIPRYLMIPSLGHSTSPRGCVTSKSVINLPVTSEFSGMGAWREMLCRPGLFIDSRVALVVARGEAGSLSEDH
ncbi:hypothetical protein NDU88_000334 [Pleurodeles waltl]|uniref:Uncharacterized protein n=1 Tax=Pleurodeles waltl TaxID=8319 RepID=A0AAV7S8B2_PLEWA|nr:hypothetical protein NDU88_000334 [Pleurodeles waltl]